MPHPERSRVRRGQPIAVAIARSTLASLVALTFEHCGIETTSVRDLARAETEVARARPELLVIELARRGAGTFLSRAADGAMTVALVELERGVSSFAAFAAGADQVVRVPFTPDELAVRAAALLRRSGHPSAFMRNRRFAGMELSLDEYVRFGSRTVQLGPRANSLLYLFAANTGRHLSWAEIRSLAWGIGDEASDGAVHRRIRSLSRALGPDAPLRVVADGDGVTARILPE